MRKKTRRFRKKICQKDLAKRFGKKIKNFTESFFYDKISELEKTNTQNLEYSNRFLVIGNYKKMEVHQK